LPNYCLPGMPGAERLALRARALGSIIFEGAQNQPGDLVAADVVAGAPGRLPQLARPVDPVVVLPQLHEDRPRAEGARALAA
jgi:hypothetical protein